MIFDSAISLFHNRQQSVQPLVNPYHHFRVIIDRIPTGITKIANHTKQKNVFS